MKLKSKLKLFYLDDGTLLAGNPETVLEDINNTLISESKKIGLMINPAKCELFFTSNIVTEFERNLKIFFQEFKLCILQNFHSGSPLCVDGYQKLIEDNM